MDLSEMTHSSYGKSDCHAIDADLEIEPSPATPSERLTENSIAEDANMENNYDDDFIGEDWSIENEGRFSESFERCSYVDSHTDSYYADIKNNSEQSFDIESSIDVDPHTSGNYSYVECSVDDDHVQLTRTRCSANMCFTEEDDIETIFIYADSRPSDRRSAPIFSGEDFPSETSSNGYSEGDIFIPDVSSGSSAASSCDDAVSERTSLTKEESSAAPASAAINSVTDCGPIAVEDEVWCNCWSCNPSPKDAIAMLEAIDLEIEPSPATPSERLTENSIAEDANMENNYDDDFIGEDWSIENEGRFPESFERCSYVDSHTDSYDADIKNNSEQSFDIKSSIDVDPQTSGNYSYVECSVDDDHVQLTRTRCSANMCFTEEDDIETISIYADSRPSNRRSAPIFSGEDFPSETSSNGYSEGDIFIPDVSSGSLAASNCDDAVSERTSLSKEESSAAPASAAINPVTDCGPIAIAIEDDVWPNCWSCNPSPKDGAAAVEEKKKKTLFQRIREFFCRFIF
ncbi:hypothetical protein D9C73_020154 [Collichthys lucidus]|uniref:Uncharacterized protein n=1 Tax=Collichthys lucidus TaxID=240159 RepID=A0A4U5VBI3_COLLU|nr:hypothetical protein D9C73_020154 [Collichthys lucidus]